MRKMGIRQKLLNFFVKRKLFSALFTVLILESVFAAIFIYKFGPQNFANKTQNEEENIGGLPPIQTQNTFAFPIDQFKERITKKPFGIYITPQNSPISPERFTGYHTGVDVEYQDITSDVPVYAIADGKIVLSETASGYGGVFMAEIGIDGKPHNVLYGHIRPSSLPKTGQEFKKGEKLALLGTGFSKETDNERKHLHFAVLSDTRDDIKGYVQNKSELSGWIDPLVYFESRQGRTKNKLSLGGYSAS